ncbi:MAG: hypothetical protein HUU23_15390 [Caldilineales bacterium]|nr:hypothetical protein [Caldilineales bacterium]
MAIPDPVPAPAGITLLFGCGRDWPPERWSAFMAYFAHRGDPCYAVPLPAAWPRDADPSLPPILLVLAAHLGASALAPHPRQPRAALALLQPPLSLLPPLLYRAIGARGAAPPIWVALGAARPLSVRLWQAAFPTPSSPRSPGSVHIHPFQGLHHALPDLPGWERIAFALRRHLLWPPD